MSDAEFAGSLMPMHPISYPVFCGAHTPIHEWARCAPRRRTTIWGTWPPNLSALSASLALDGAPRRTPTAPILMGGMSGGIRQRVIDAAEAHLANGGYVAPVEVLSWVGWVHGNQMDAWRQGRVESFEELMQTGAGKRAEALRVLEEWARERGLRPSETAYVTTTRDRRPLRFTKDADEATERFYRTHWLSPELSEKQRERLVEKQSRPPDLVVILPLNEWTCALCGGTGDFLTMEPAGPICLTCAELDHLVFLPAGNATLS